MVLRWLKAWRNATEEDEQMCCSSWLWGVLVTWPWWKQSSSSAGNKAGNLSSDNFGDKKRFLRQHGCNRWWQGRLACESWFAFWDLHQKEEGATPQKTSERSSNQEGAHDLDADLSWNQNCARGRQDKFCFKFFRNMCSCSDQILHLDGYK